MAALHCLVQESARRKRVAMHPGSTLLCRRLRLFLAWFLFRRCSFALFSFGLLVSDDGRIPDLSSRKRG